MKKEDKKFSCLLVLLMILILVLSACSGGSTGGNDPTGENIPMAKIAFPIEKVITVETNSSISFTSEHDGLNDCTFVWDFADSGASPVSAMDTGEIAFNKAGEFTVKFTVTNKEGNSASDIRKIVVLQREEEFNPYIKVLSPADNLIIEEGAQVMFSSTVHGGKPPFSFSWNFDGSVTGTQNLQNPGNIILTSARLTPYNISVTVTDKDGRFSTDQVKVTVKPKTLTADIISPAISGSTFNVTPGSNTTFKGLVQAGVGSITRQWFFDDETLPRSTTDELNLTSPDTIGTHTIKFTATDESGKTSEASLKLIVTDLAVNLSVLKTGSNPNKYYLNEPVTATVTAAGGKGDYSVRWFVNSAEVQGANQFQYVLPSSVAGDFNVYALVTDSISSQKTNSVTVHIENEENTAPQIIAINSTENIIIGTPASFTCVTAKGNGQLTMHWVLKDYAESVLLDVNTPSDTISYNFLTKGIYSLECTATDIDGDKGNTFVKQISKFTKVLYVKETAAGSGSSWNEAAGLQDAIASASKPESDIDEIWVAKGVYKPAGSADRSASFNLAEGVTIYGGFAGNEILSNQRDYLTNVTTLSGDIGNTGNKSDNSYHVVIGAKNATLDGFTITGGNANGDPENINGGGLYNTSPSLTVINCTFSLNSSSNFGGGIYNSGNLAKIKNCTFKSNTATEGGGIYNYNCELVSISNSTFSAINYAEINGGGIYNELSTPVIANCTLAFNQAATGNGGGLYSKSGSPIIDTCTFSGNAAGMNGSGMYNESGNPIVSSSVFAFNYASAGSGGGICNLSGSLKVNNSSFSKNGAYNEGGGIYNESAADSSVSDCTFAGNYSSESNGGGMCNKSSDIKLFNCTFNSNSAQNAGGGIYNDSSSLIITSCTFTQNGNILNSSRGGRGCGIYNNSSHPQITNCVFTQNKGLGTEAAGGGIYNNSSNPTVINCTFAWNQAEANGNEIYNANSSPGISNSIIRTKWNTAYLISNTGSSSPVFSYSNVHGSGGSTAWNSSFGTDGTGNIDADPLFVELTLFLSAGSPCIDKGLNSAVPQDILTDRIGNPRIMDGDDIPGAIVDMGAYEYQK